MAYQRDGLVQATDYNTYVGSNPSSDPAGFNTVYATGNGNKGYGQPYVPGVILAENVTAAEWRAIMNSMEQVAKHQGTSLDPYTLPVVGGTIEALQLSSDNYPLASWFTSSLARLYSNRNNAVAQSAPIVNTAISNQTFSEYAVFDHTITFESSEKARYFFNAGGQVSLSFSHPNGTGINQLWNSLSSSCGTLTLSSPTSGTITVAGNTYTGLTRTNGSGTPNIFLTNSGYYSLSSTNTILFKQFATVGPSDSLSSYIEVKVRTDGTALHITTTFMQGFSGVTRPISGTGTLVTCTAIPPAPTYLQNTWGTPTISSTYATQSVTPPVVIIKPELIPTPTSLDLFGTTAKTISLRNAGSADISIASYTIPNWATHNGKAQVLQPGVSVTLTLTPITKPVGTYSGTLVVTHDGLNGTTSVPLTLTVERPHGTVTLTGAPGTWTVPTDVDSVTVTLIGGGGAGGYSSINSLQNSGGGGGSGGITTTTLSVTPGQKFNYIIGGGGTAVTNAAAGQSGNKTFNLALNQLYLQGNKSGNWSTYMRTNAVWISAAGNEFGTFTISRIFNVPTTSSYYYRSVADNSADIYIDGTKVGSSQSFGTSTPTRYSVNLTAGAHMLKLVATNDSEAANPAGVSFILTDSTDTTTVYDLKTDLSPANGSVYRNNVGIGEPTFFYDQTNKYAAQGGRGGWCAVQITALNVNLIAPGGAGGTPNGVKGQDGEQKTNTGTTSISTRPGGGVAGTAVGGAGGGVPNYSTGGAGGCGNTVITYQLVNAGWTAGNTSISSRSYFLNTPYQVWFPGGGNNKTYTFYLNFDVAGDYQFFGSADDTSIMSVNDVAVVNTSSWNINYGQSPNPSLKYTIAAPGYHKVSIYANNITGQYGFGFQINYPNGTPFWQTLTPNSSATNGAQTKIYQMTVTINGSFNGSLGIGFGSGGGGGGLAQSSGKIQTAYTFGANGNAGAVILTW